MKSLHLWINTCLTILFTSFLSLDVSIARGDTLDTLQWKNLYPTGNDIVGVAFGGGQFVAIDSAGYALTTTDGSSWINRGFSNVRSPKTVTYAGGRFVVAGGSGEIATSEDAIAWASRASGTTQALVKVTYGNGVFVAVGAGATILSSPDGITWTIRATGLSLPYSFTGVAFASGRFVAVHNGTPPSLYTSEDGANWTLRTIPTMGPSVLIVSSGNKFMVEAYYNQGGGQNFPRPWTSSNGLDWVRDASYASGGRKVFAGGVFFGYYIYNNGTNYPISTSPDALVWTPRPSPPITLQDVAYGNGFYLGVGLSGGVVKSSDSANWFLTSSGDLSFSMSDAAYGAGRYVLVGSTILSSSDGQTFQKIDGVASGLTSVNYANGKYIAVGSGGTIIRSENGVAWNRSRSGTLKGLSAVAYGAGLWVAVGGSGEIRVSSDGLLWNGCWSGTDYQLNSITFAQGKFIIVGQNGIILSSTDGLNWAPQYTDDLGTLNDVAYGNGKFVAVGGGESVMTSADGVTWVRQAGLTGINRITFGDGKFLGTSTWEIGRPVATSVDGINWEERRVPVVAGVGAAYLEDTLMLFGANGTILQSAPVGAIVLSAASNAANGGFEVTISGCKLGATYDLQSCANLSTDTWSNVTTFVAAQTVTVVPVLGGSGAPQCYYRAVAAQ